MELKKEFTQINTKNRDELHAELNTWSENHSFKMIKIGGEKLVANINQSRTWFKCSKIKCRYTQEWRLQFEDAIQKEAKYIFIKSLHNHTCFQKGNGKGNQYSDDFCFY